MSNIDITSSSIRGPLHEKLGIERQDAAGHQFLQSLGSHIIVVADGHGDPSCSRSATGSSFAVEVTTERLGEFARAVRSAEQTHRAFLNGKLDLTRLTDSIVSGWSSKVAAHYASDPIPEIDERIATASDPIEAKAIREHLYGTTLVAALLMPDACLIVQQGDGCCAVVYSDGTVRENDEVIKPDPLCVGNVTTSLSDKAAADEIRVQPIYFDDERYVIGCMVGSDGIDKSLPPDGGTSDFAVSSVLMRLDCENSAQWKSGLDDLVSSTTDDGSGDDASAACFVHIEAVRQVEGMLREQHERFGKAQQLGSLRKKLNSMQRKRAYYLSGSAKANDEQRASYLSEYDRLSEAVTQLEDELGDHMDWKSIEKSFLEAAKNPPRPAEDEVEEPETDQAQPTDTAECDYPFDPSPSGMTYGDEPVHSHSGRGAAIIKVAVPIVCAMLLAGIVGFIVFRPVKEPQSHVEERLAVPATESLVQLSDSLTEDAQRTATIVREVYDLQDEALRSDTRVMLLLDAGVNLDELFAACQKGLHVSLVEGEDTASVVSVTPERDDATQQDDGSTEEEGISWTEHDDAMKDDEPNQGVVDEEDDELFVGSAPVLGQENLRLADFGDSDESADDEDDGLDGLDGDAIDSGQDGDQADSNDPSADADESQTTDATEQVPQSDEESGSTQDSTTTTKTLQTTSMTVTVWYDGPEVNDALTNACTFAKLAVTSPQRKEQAQAVIDAAVKGGAATKATPSDGDATSDDSQGDGQDGNQSGTQEQKVSQPERQSCVIVVAKTADAKNGPQWTIRQGDAQLKTMILSVMGLLDDSGSNENAAAGENDTNATDDSAYDDGSGVDYDEEYGDGFEYDEGNPGDQDW